MARTIVLYALALAAGTFLLEWLKFRHFTQVFSTEIYIALVGVACTALGVWAGNRLTRRHRPSDAPFVRNDAAAAALGLTAREIEILELLASGRSLKELGRDLGVSPNTVKTHVARVYQKLDVGKRIAAVEKARSLSIIA